MSDDIEVRVSEGRPAEATYNLFLLHCVFLHDEPEIHLSSEGRPTDEFFMSDSLSR